MITGLFYIMLGCLFTYIAIYYGDESIWGMRTLIPALFATLDFGVGIRFLRIHCYIKKSQGK